MTGNVERAKAVLSKNSRVLYGIFGVIAASAHFPPHAMLNEFLMSGSDPCDQDRRMTPWQPFHLSPGEFADIEAWWLTLHPRATTDSLGAADWNGWMLELLHSRDL